MRYLLILAMLLLPSAAMAQAPVSVPLQMMCSPFEAWSRADDMKPILGGIDSSRDIWNVYASEKGFNILVTFNGMICLVGSGNEVGDHLVLPIPAVKKGEAS